MLERFADAYTRAEAEEGRVTLQIEIDMTGGREGRSREGPSNPPSEQGKLHSFPIYT